MAEKKVILKDGADELLPKTSASMVFTESGQTVEAALQNAGTGGGGTGGGIDEEQLAQYLQEHKYITQTELDEAHYLKPTSEITGYTKAASYAALDPTDTLNEALGKLEAGIGSGGAGGGDNIYWLPSDILNLSSVATHEEILAALGGSLEPIFEATKAGKVFLIKYNIFDLIVYDIPVNVYFISGVKIVRLSFMFYGSNGKNTNALIIINADTADTSKSYVMKIRMEGYSLDTNFYTLDSDSSSDTISTAVGGESGFKNIIKSVNSGSRLVVRESPYNIDLLTNIAQVSDNGDMLLSFTRIITSVEIVSISYTKSSNTFSCTVTPISMGS